MTDIAGPGPKSARRRSTRRVMAGVAGALIALAMLPAQTAIAATDQDPYHKCTTGRLATSMTGVTRNDTDLELIRVYDEKGALNSWGQEPAASIAPRGAPDRWCVYAHHFGTAMKVEYALPNGDKVYFAADRYLFGDASASCHVTGPTQDAYNCSARVSRRIPGESFYTARHVHVEFAVRAKSSG